MKLLADENFPLASVRYLRSKGFDILYIGEENPSILDPEVMRLAIEQERTILTFDRDFGELIFREGTKPEKGVIYLRLDSYRPDDPGILIEQLIHSGDHEFENAITVIDERGIRQRKY